MKARIGFLLVTLVFAAAVGFAAEGLPWWSSPWTESFRSASTASLLEDDLDIMLDPARMPSLEGYRLYTQLSNIFDKNEEVFNHNLGNKNYYMLGGCGNLMGYGKLGLIYDRNMYRTNDTSRTNTSTITYSAAQIPVSRSVTDYTDYGGEQRQDTHWWFGFGREFGFGKLGAVIYHQNSYEKVQPFSTENQKVETQVNDLINGRMESMSTTENTRTNNIHDNTWGGALSFWRGLMDKLDVGLAVGLNAHTANEYDTIIHTYDYSNPAATFGHVTAQRNETRDLIPHDHVGAEIDARVAAVWKWSENVNTRTDLTFSTLSGSRDDGAVAITYDSTESYTIPTGTWSYVRTEATNAPVHQEDSYTSVGLFSKTTAKFGEKVELAMGLGLSSHKRDYLTSYTGPFNRRNAFNDGDPALWTDYYEYYDATEDYSLTYTESQTNVYAPVGLQFKITDNFVFRLGAYHTFSYRDTTWNETDLQSNVRVMIVNPNTNDTTQGVAYNPFTNTNAELEQGRHAWNETYYTYGAGWTISENLQLDFMGFAALDDMHNWKLSAVIKF